jgi:hypothetical protein
MWFQTDSVDEEGAVELALDALVGLKVDLIVHTTIVLVELNHLVVSLGAGVE